LRFCDKNEDQRSILTIFLSSYGMYLLCTTNLIISYKNLPLLFTLGGWLEEKNKPNRISILMWNNEQISGQLHITFCTIFLNILINLLFVIQRHIFLMYHEFAYKSQKPWGATCYFRTKF